MKDNENDMDLFDEYGEIDQMRFFNAALTASQVTELYNEVACT